MFVAEVNQLEMAPDWHPLAWVDEWLLAAGWTPDGDKGFIPPREWREPIAIRYGHGKHYGRQMATCLTIAYYENRGKP